MNSQCKGHTEQLRELAKLHLMQQAESACGQSALDRLLEHMSVVRAAQEVRLLEASVAEIERRADDSQDFE